MYVCENIIWNDNAGQAAARLDAWTCLSTLRSDAAMLQCKVVQTHQSRGQWCATAGQLHRWIRLQPPGAHILARTQCWACTASESSCSAALGGQAAASPTATSRAAQLRGALMAVHEVLNGSDTLWLRAQIGQVEVLGSASLCTMCSAGSDQHFFAVRHVQIGVIAALGDAPHDQWSPSAGAAAAPGTAARLPQPLHPPPAPAQAVRA